MILVRCLTLLLCGLFITSSWAAVPKMQAERVRELKSRSAGLISEAANRRLLRAQELASLEKYKEALSLLQSYIANDVRPTEKAQFLQNIGFIHAQSGNYDGAIKALNEALQMKQLPYTPTVSTQFALGQLYLAKENYKKAVEIIEDWFRLVQDPKAESYVVLATAYAQTGKQKQALELVEVAIDKSDKPSENWLVFALGLNFEMENWARCADLLEHLTAQFPQKSQYWKQLSGIYLNLNQNEKALAALELAYKQGHLEKEGEFVNLAALYLDQGIPLNAARLLENKIKEGRVKSTASNLELMGDSYLAAREVDKALVAFSQAAEAAEDGKVLAKKGQLLLDQENWKQASQDLLAALNKGGINSPEQLHLGIGIAQFNLQNYNEAMEHFRKAYDLKEDFRAARQWMNYVETAQQSVATGL